MTVTSVEYFELIKDYTHPNVERFVNDYKNGNKLYFLHFTAAAIGIKMELENS